MLKAARHEGAGQCPHAGHHCGQGEEESPGQSQDLVRCQVFPMGLYRYREELHSPWDRCCSSNNFDQHSRRVLRKGGVWGIAGIIWRLSFLFYSNSSRIWLPPSHWEAFCCLLKSGVLLFPQFLNLLLFMSVAFWQGHLKNELYFPFWQGRGSGRSRKTDG